MQAAACGSDENLQVDDATGLEKLKAAVNCSGGGDVVAVWSGDVTFESPVLVGSGIFLNVLGQGGVGAVARGNLQTRLFVVSSGAQLKLSKLKLVEGRERNGGAILSHGSLTLDTCEFVGNNASTEGGAIWANGSLTLDTCEFVGNNAKTNGGAIWAGAGNVTISGVEFLNNNAASFGGAVFTMGAGLVIDDGTLFDGNQAEEGGAVYCRGSNDSSSEDSLLTAPCTLRGAIFLNNIASTDKSVKYDKIEDFDANDDEMPWTNLYGGGAATFLNAEVNISNCVFTENSAQVAGGALYGGIATDLNISGCTFEGNIALGYGAAIAASSATFGGGTELIGNNARRHGGAVSTPHSTLLMSQ